jgi:hypothetical protein
VEGLVRLTGCLDKDVESFVRLGGCLVSLCEGLVRLRVCLYKDVKSLVELKGCLHEDKEGSVLLTEASAVDTPYSRARTPLFPAALRGGLVSTRRVVTHKNVASQESGSQVNLNLRLQT